MNRLKKFDKALFSKQIGGTILIVILDVIYLISGIFFGMMEIQYLLRYILFINMLATCILYHNFILCRGDMEFELITEKIVYYPTTRYQFLLNKYAKTIIFLAIQLTLNFLCLGLGYLAKDMSMGKVLGSILTVCIAILFTSGVAIITMHTMPLGIYLAMIIYIPLNFLINPLENMLVTHQRLMVNIYVATALIVGIIIGVWFLLFWIGGKIYKNI